MWHALGSLAALLSHQLPAGEKKSKEEGGQQWPQTRSQDFDVLAAAQRDPVLQAVLWMLQQSIVIFEDKKNPFKQIPSNILVVQNKTLTHLQFGDNYN